MGVDALPDFFEVEIDIAMSAAALINQGRAFVAATVPELHRVTGRGPRRWRWRYGINLLGRRSARSRSPVIHP